MNFTREPIIETVITPREGCKLLLRNSKEGSSEEYIVEAVEVVSFGRSFFFRSIEGSKSFLLPVSDYEVLESKETRMVLKNVQGDRSIKIGGGRDAQFRPQQPREPRREPVQTEEEPALEGASSQPQQAPAPQQHDRKRDNNNKRRRGRRGRGGDRPHEGGHSQSHSGNQAPREENAAHNFSEDASASLGGVSQSDEPPKAPSFISKLFPPPPTLIKETLSRYKTTEEGEIYLDTQVEKVLPEETIFDHPISNHESDEDTHLDDR